MEASVADDPSKKRDSAQVEHVEEEKSKKVRVFQPDGPRSPTRRVVLRESSGKEQSPKNESLLQGYGSFTSEALVMDGSRNRDGPSTGGIPKIWSVESALLYVVQIEGDQKEFLLKDHDKSPWLTFSVGHAGDASTIAHWYRQSTSNENPEVDTGKLAETTTEATEDDSRSMLEVWLADGLGDEDTPPVVHALLAYIHYIDDGNVKTDLAVVALLTLDWDEGERALQVQWMHIDANLQRDIAEILEQRTWLRISILSKMTACQVVIADEKLSLAALNAKTIAKEQPSPSAE